ncbi:hypothetical protein KR018_010165 [Drosophila ironensis]|nr:hypothetical protein KR018_010165 [Drosophila ironensis]
MDDIRSSMDNMMALFNDSVTHSAPKKLIFNRLSNSFADDADPVPSTKKRRMEMQEDFNPNASSGSLNSSTDEPRSMQYNRMRADILESQARNARLMSDLGLQRKEHMREMAEEQKKSAILREQLEVAKKKLQELESSKQGAKHREELFHEDARACSAELKALKNQHEIVVARLLAERSRQEDDARQVQMSLNSELAEYRRSANRMDLELQSSRNELDRLRRRYEEFKSRTANHEELRAQHEKQELLLRQANERVKQLEFEIQSYKDWKELTTSAQERLPCLPDMQDELERLRSHNRHLKTLIGDKLLLEEQVHDYKSRLDKEENARAEAVALQVKLTHVELELKEWVKVAQDHCLPNTLVCPMALRSRIEQLLQEDIVHVADSRSLQSETSELKAKLEDLELRCRDHGKTIEDQNVVLKRHKIFKDRLQRKLLTVSKERDFYRQMMENFDKDLTLSNSSVADMTQDAQVRCRLEVLERTVNGYKQMCTTLERELQVSRQQEPLPEPPSESYENLKKDLEAVRRENETLRRRKEELELELMHRCLRGDFNVKEYKVVHLRTNPAAEAYKASENMMEKLQAEIERLKRRNKKLEDDEEQRVNESTSTGGMTMNFKEFNQLRAELESANAKNRKMKDYFIAARDEFRDVCYMLLGYRIDRSANGSYQISSMYAESPDDYLNIAVNEDNCLVLLESPYAETLQPPACQQLAASNSFPAFFSNLTLELFQRSTVTIA